MMHYLSINLFAFMPIIFFTYGLAFFVLGATITLENLSSAQSSPSVGFIQFIRSAWGGMAVFGLLHGLYEFMGAFNIVYGGLPVFLKILRLLILAISFYFLCRFGALHGRKQPGTGFLPLINLPNILTAAWLVLCLALLRGTGYGGRWLSETGIAARYVIGIPSGLLAAFALAASAKGEERSSRKYLIAASSGFVLFGAGLLITTRADFFPMSVLNYESLYRAVHVPVQVLRTACTVLITFSLLMFFRLSRSFSSIRFKAILHVIIAVVIPAFCIILLVSYLMARSLLALSYREDENLASLSARGMEASLLDAEKAVKYNMFVAWKDRTVPLKDFLVPVLQEDDAISGVVFFDDKGEIFRAVKTPLSDVIEFRGDATGPRIRNVLAGLTPKAALVNFYMGRHDASTVPMIFPLPFGRMEILLDLERLYDSTGNPDIGQDRHVLIVDGQGSLVVHGSGGHLIRQAVFKRPGLKRNDYGRTITENGTLYNAIEVRIDPIGWSLVMEIPRKDIVAPVFGVFKGLIIGILAIYLSAVVVATLAVRRITMPINRIAGRVKSIGKGDFSSVLNVKTGDEIQTLSEEVEKMAVMLVEKREMEKRIVQTQKIASLGRLVAVVAHEINNPLSVIIWSSELLLRELKPGDRRHEDLKMLEKHAIACKKIVDDLLRFSRTGKQVVMPVDINRNIEETLALIGKQMKGNISLSLDFDPSSPKVEGDPDKLRQVFLNLAVNAVDAMKKEGGGLTVRTRLTTAGSEGMVEVTFSDTGCGIRQEDIEHIFDPFFTTKEAGEGTGLGLSVSYGIISDHNGRMWVESAEGKGSTFHIVLPALRN